MTTPNRLVAGLALTLGFGCSTGEGAVDVENTDDPAPLEGATAREGASELATEGQVRRTLHGRGYTFETMDIDEVERTVTLDGDMVADLDELLADSDAYPQGGTLIDKGYYAGVSVDIRGAIQTYHTPVATSVRLVFNSVDSDWVTAFNQAAAEWSRATCIEFTSSGAQTISIAFGAIEPSKYAQASLPLATFRRDPPFVIPGSGVTLNSAHDVGLEFLSAGLKLQVALHELGHTLGFKHPTEGTLVTGTSSGTGYDTVMAAGFGEPGLVSLTADDVRTRDIVFAPDRRQDDRGQVFTSCPTR